MKKQIRFNTQALISQFNIDLSELNKLEEVREMNNSYPDEWVVNIPHTVEQGSKSAYRSLLSSYEYASRNTPYDYTNNILEAIRDVIVKSANCWRIKGKYMNLGVVVPETAFQKPGEDFITICYWAPQNRYSLLLDWGWNDEFFLKENCEEWGHEKCSYKITGLTRDEITIISALWEAGAISDNYYSAWQQITSLVEGDFLPPVAWFEEQEDKYMSDEENIDKYNFFLGDEDKKVVDVEYDANGYVSEIMFQCQKDHSSSGNCNCHRTWWQNV